MANWMPSVLTVFRVLALGLGVFFVYIAAFTYETTDKRIQSRLEDFWVRLADFRHTPAGLIRRLARAVLAHGPDLRPGVRTEPIFDSDSLRRCLVRPGILLISLIPMLIRHKATLSSIGLGPGVCAIAPPGELVARLIEALAPHSRSN
jgi:hypothetical protein